MDLNASRKYFAPVINFRRMTAKKSEQTSVLFKDYNCAQTIFSLFAPEFGLDTETALKIASGFGSGMNRGETCGAVTGAYMVLGLKSGHATSNQEDKARTRDLIIKFNDLFLQEHSSLSCKELLGYDLSLPGQKVKASEAGVFQSRCPLFLRTAARILEENF
jgi:C_GCAxxG_C_C family probable redox protein